MKARIIYTGDYRWDAINAIYQVIGAKSIMFLLKGV